ncbi:MAG: chemotaxis protein CheD [Planctomycetota bacterium]|jgi:chemotaxis protein CheD|nr:chemotaxis protein CheD [Planctomycetota bacterium]
MESQLATDGRYLRPVGVGELAISDDPFEVLATYSLGSCVGVAAFDPVAAVAGLLHAQIPLSRQDPKQAASWPARFTDTGMLALLDGLYARGAKADRLVVKAAGGSSLLDEEGRFRIGERNIAVLRKVLWRNAIALSASDLGGSHPRTMYFHVRDGRLDIRSHGTTAEL